MKSRRYDLEDVPWRAVRPDITRGVEGKALIPPGLKAESAVLTRVAPAGEFLPHADRYHHVILVLEGEGEGFVGEAAMTLKPGTVVEIPAGERHGYRNAAPRELLLLTFNIPTG